MAFRRSRGGTGIARSPRSSGKYLVFPRPWLSVGDDGERDDIEGRKGVSYGDHRCTAANWDAPRRCLLRLCISVVLKWLVPHGAPGSTMCFLDLGSVLGMMGSRADSMDAKEHGMAM